MPKLRSKKDDMIFCRIAKAEKTRFKALCEKHNRLPSEIVLGLVLQWMKDNDPKAKRAG